MIFHKRSGLIILTKYLMKISQPRLRMQKNYGNPGNDEESYDEILDTDISELEVKKAIQRLKSGEKVAKLQVWME